MAAVFAVDAALARDPRACDPRVPPAPQSLARAVEANKHIHATAFTQPRRIAAMSVAERIASERGEALGQTVGYAIRGQHAGGARTGGSRVPRRLRRARRAV